MANSLQTELGIPSPAYALPLMSAHKLSLKHHALLVQVEKLFEQRLIRFDLKQSEPEQIDDLIALSGLLETLMAENSSLRNPYGAAELFQRLVKQQQQLLDEIAALQDKSTESFSAKELTVVEQDLAVKQQTLSTELKIAVVDITKEITDAQKRDKAARLAAKTKRATKVKHTLSTHIAPSVEAATLFVNLTVNNFLNTKTILSNVWTDKFKAELSDLSAQDKEAGAALGLFFGFYGLISVALLMTVGRGFKGERHDSVNLVLQAISSSLTTSKNILNTITAFNPSFGAVLQITPALSFVPFLGTTASLISLGVAIGNIIRTERTYEQNRQLFATTFNDTTEFRDGSKPLSADEVKLKESLLKALSLKSACKNPDLIKSLFTREEFDQEIKPKLIAHAEKERNKQLAKLAIGVTITLVTMTLALASIFIPAFGPAIGLALVIIGISAFITRFTLDKTILKPNADIAFASLIVASIDSMMQASADVAQDVAAHPSHIDAADSRLFAEEFEEMSLSEIGASPSPGPLVFGYTMPDAKVPDTGGDQVEGNPGDLGNPNPTTPTRGG